MSTPPVASRARRDAVAGGAEAELLKTVHALLPLAGTGQEMGDEADGPGVNRRRGALSVLMSRHDDDALSARLPKTKRSLLARLGADLEWLRAAERQPLANGRAFDFGWSQNPMSTPEVLSELAARRADAAQRAAEEIRADPSRAYDASNDGLLCHLALDDPKLRAQVLADTLVQMRARRRSTLRMDEALAPAGDELARRADGRIGSSGAVSAFEQRLACRELARGDSLDARREHALLRWVVASATGGSISGLYEARNTVAILRDYLGMDVIGEPIADAPGLDVSVFDAIHKNYSANTPRAVDYYVRQRAFTAGPEAARVEVLRELIAAARAPQLESAKKHLERAEQKQGRAVPGAAEAGTQAQLTSAVVKHLRASTNLRGLKRGLSVEGTLRAAELILSVHASVNQTRPTAQTLERELFYAGRAWGEVASLIHALKADDHVGSVHALGLARTALSRAFFQTRSGFERQMLVRLDRKIERLGAELLGTSVERLDPARGEAALGEGVIALGSALRGVLASGLDAVRERPRTATVAPLAEVLTKTEALLAAGGATQEELRALATQIHVSAGEVADTMRAYLRRREAAIRFSGVDVDLDPELADGLVKETALHYLLSLSEKMMRWGRTARVSADEISTGDVRVLSSTGPRVYRRILVAPDVEALRKFRPTVDDLCVVQSADEKELVWGGGLVLDAKDAGPGYSHASVFAKGHGISAVALPGLDAAVEAFFGKASKQQGGGFYVDDSSGRFVVKPLASALQEGLLTEKEVERRRPGYNLDVDYFDVVEGGRVLIKHEAARRISKQHETRKVELFVPDLTDALGLGGPVSFEALAEVPLDRLRQIAGEKGAVLVKLAAWERLKALGVEVPGGAVVPPFCVAELLEAAKSGRGSLLEAWRSATERVRALGAGPDDVQAREEVAQATRARVARGLRALLLDGERPTPAGRKLLERLAKSPGLPKRAPWIFRSSFTGEDRPGKSAAGQYDSVPGCVTAKSRLEGLIRVIASAWNPGAVESNVASGIDLSMVWPAVVVQRCLPSELSGVGVSRGPEGGLGRVGYQAKRGFGGGVDGGRAEEGVLDASGTVVRRALEDGSILSTKLQATLRAAILEIEEEFNRSIEPGKQYAVDVEWATVGSRLNVLQARVLLGA